MNRDKDEVNRNKIQTWISEREEGELNYDNEIKQIILWRTKDCI